MANKSINQYDVVVIKSNNLINLQVFFISFANNCVAALTFLGF